MGESGLPSRPGMGNPLSQFAGDDFTQRAALEFVSSSFQKSQMFENVNSRLSSFVKAEGLRRYFAVDHSYVLKKLRLILLPFLHKDSWDRQRDSQKQERLLPTEDVMAPDLYIPCMAFVTYILAIGLSSAARQEFSPELLGHTATFGLLVIGLETAILKGVIKYFQGREASWFELLALASYKYVGVVISTLFSILFGGIFLVGKAITLLLGVSMAYFMRQSLRPIVLRHEVEESAEERKMKKYAVFLLAGLQIVLLFLMS